MTNLGRRVKEYLNEALYTEIERDLASKGVHDAEEHAAKAVLSVWQDLKRGWLVENGLLPMAKKKARFAVKRAKDLNNHQLSLVFESELNLTEIMVGPDSTLNEVQRRGLLMALREAIMRLPTKERAVILCRFFMDDSHEEIARLLDMSIRTIQRYQKRALVRLRSDAVLLSYLIDKDTHW